MIEENSIYACAVLMCFDELRDEFLSKKSQLELKYPKNPDRVRRAMRRFAYQLPDELWDVESESAMLTYIESFLLLNNSKVDLNVLVWSNGIDWTSVCGLFQENQSLASKEGLKALYRSKIESMLGGLAQKRSFFDGGLIDLCVKHSFLSNAKRLSFGVSPLSLDLEREDIVCANLGVENKLAKLYFYWDNGFIKSSKTQLFTSKLPLPEYISNCLNCVLDFSGLSLTGSDREFLVAKYYQSFPAQKYSVSKRDEVLLLNYFISNAKPNANVCVLVSSSFLNRLGVDQSYRQYLLAAKRVHAVVALPRFELHKSDESSYLLVLKGSENKEVTFVDGRHAYFKTVHGNALNTEVILTLFGGESDKSASCEYAHIEAKQNRLEPSMYLVSGSDRITVQWKDIELIELKIVHLSKAIIHQLDNRVEQSKPKKTLLPEDLMSRLILSSIAVFEQLPSSELKKLSKRILVALPKMEPMVFMEFLDDAVYAVSDRFDLGFDFDALDDLAENISKKKHQFLL